jgi:predicted glycoside hydrolase/deacetylase ChbG (UPF0249 family)
MVETLPHSDAPARRRALYLRADDIGCCTAANDAIVASVTVGAVRNVSVMVPGPAFEDAAARLRELAASRDFAVGLHVTLNSEWETCRWGPVASASRVQSLVTEHGHFFNNPQQLMNAGGKLPEMLYEVEAQLHKLRSTGLDVVYLDEHMGVGWLPGLRDALRSLCEKEHLRYVNQMAPLPELPALSPHDSLGKRLHGRLDLLSNYPHDEMLAVFHPMFHDASAEQLLENVSAAAHVLATRDEEARVLTDPHLCDQIQRRGAVPAAFTPASAPPAKVNVSVNVERRVSSPNFS